jgi:hypothetical protein
MPSRELLHTTPAGIDEVHVCRRQAVYSGLIKLACAGFIQCLVGLLPEVRRLIHKDRIRLAIHAQAMTSPIARAVSS